MTYPLRIRTSFSTPIELTRFRSDVDSVDKRNLSPPLHFSPIYSPFPTSQVNKPNERKPSIGSFRFNSTTPISKLLPSISMPMSLSKPTTSVNGRKASVTFNLSENKTRFTFAEPTTSPNDRRRNSSGNRIIHRHKMT
jgi:hypothetical protein